MTRTSEDSRADGPGRHGRSLACAGDRGQSLGLRGGGLPIAEGGDTKPPPIP